MTSHLPLGTLGSVASILYLVISYMKHMLWNEYRINWRIYTVESSHWENWNHLSCTFSFSTSHCCQFQVCGILYFKSNDGYKYRYLDNFWQFIIYFAFIWVVLHMYYERKLDTHIFPTRANIHIQPLVKESPYWASRAKHFRYFRCRLLTIMLIEMPV